MRKTIKFSDLIEIAYQKDSKPIGLYKIEWTIDLIEEVKKTEAMSSCNAGNFASKNYEFTHPLDLIFSFAISALISFFFISAWYAKRNKRVSSKKQLKKQSAIPKAYDPAPLESIKNQKLMIQGSNNGFLIPPPPTNLSNEELFLNQSEGFIKKSPIYRCVCCNGEFTWTVCACFELECNLTAPKFSAHESCFRRKLAQQGLNPSKRKDWRNARCVEPNCGGHLIAIQKIQKGGVFEKPYFCD